jgi:hypothetical protein
MRLRLFKRRRYYLWRGLVINRYQISYGTHGFVYGIAW